TFASRAVFLCAFASLREAHFTKLHIAKGGVALSLATALQDRVPRFRKRGLRNVAGIGRALCYRSRVLKTRLSVSHIHGLALTIAGALAPLSGVSAADWLGHGGDPQHTAISDVATQPFTTVRWSATVDTTAPTEPIFIHYGAP